MDAGGMGSCRVSRVPESGRASITLARVMNSEFIHLQVE